MLAVVRNASLLLLILFLLIIPTGCSNRSSPPAAEDYVRAEGIRLIAPDGEPLLLRGINLSNWLIPDAKMWQLERDVAPWQIDLMLKALIGPEDTRLFWQRYYDTYITRADIHHIKSLGLNTVRVPFNYKLLTPEDHPGVWLPRGFALLDSVVTWSKTEGLYVILDMQAAPCGQTGTTIDDSHGNPWLYESPACRRRTIDIWRRIATRYHDEPTVIGYELLNAPLPNFPGYNNYFDVLEELYIDATYAIREEAPHQLIFLGGAVWNTHFGIFGPPFTRNLVYTFHKIGRTPGINEIQEYLDFRGYFNIPLMMGERGENGKNWVAPYRRLLEAHEISWAFWPYKKMDTAISVRVVIPPVYWFAIVKFMKQSPLDSPENKPYRPSREQIHFALDGLLKNIAFDETIPNIHYAAALTAP